MFNTCATGSVAGGAEIGCAIDRDLRRGFVVDDVADPHDIGRRDVDGGAAGVAVTVSLRLRRSKPEA